MIGTFCMREGWFPLHDDRDFFANGISPVRKDVSKKNSPNPAFLDHGPRLADVWGM